MIDTESPELQSLQGRVARWRRQHGGPGRRLPDWVWEEAAEVAQDLGVSTTARALRLAPKRLERMLGETYSPRDPRDEKDGLAFVELGAGEVDLLGGVTVELEHIHGTGVRISGAKAEAVARVAASLLMVGVRS